MPPSLRTSVRIGQGGFSLADAAYLYLFTPGGQFPSPAKEASLEINNLPDDWNLSANARALQGEKAALKSI